ncbi:MAG: sigma-70 family RNA polymerase sigma factor [Clostridia bacterium]|nr:sigma-70 family RNA polymerase sigma factor [Clostridia bacterium]
MKAEDAGCEPRANSILSERQALMERHLGLVRALASRFCGRGVDHEELFQSGCVGLAAAANSFDSTRGIEFSSYAFKFIEGAMREQIRRDRPIALPRSKYASLMELKRLCGLAAGSDGDSRLGSAAKALRISEDELSERLFEAEMLTSFCYGFDGEEYGEGGNNGETGKKAAIEAACFDVQCINRAFIMELLNKLDELQKRVIVHRYFFERSQAETADLIGISQSTVSRLEKAALLKLKTEEDR